MTETRVPQFPFVTLYPDREETFIIVFSLMGTPAAEYGWLDGLPEVPTAGLLAKGCEWQRRLMAAARLATTLGGREWNYAMPVGTDIRDLGFVKFGVPAEILTDLSALGSDFDQQWLSIGVIDDQGEERRVHLLTELPKPVLAMTMGDFLSANGIEDLGEADGGEQDFDLLCDFSGDDWHVIRAAEAIKAANEAAAAERAAASVAGASPSRRRPAMPGLPQGNIRKLNADDLDLDQTESALTMYALMVAGVDLNDERIVANLRAATVSPWADLVANTWVHHALKMSYETDLGFALRCTGSGPRVAEQPYWCVIPAAAVRFAGK